VAVFSEAAALQERARRALGDAARVFALSAAAPAVVDPAGSRPDVVLLAGAVGAAMAERLRGEASSRSFPLVLLAARESAAFAADVDEVLVEPVSDDDLAARVLAQARRGRAREEALRLERAARAEAEASNRAKDEFIAMISHELRTPLGAILIWAQLLKTEELDQVAVGRAVGMIERSTKTLAQLIDDLLDASRIIAGKLTFEMRPIDLRAVIEAAADAASPAAEGKGLALERDIVGALPPVSGDPGRLQQVVGNLLANAVKFTPEGGRVRVSLEHVGAVARVRVSDTGSGIEPQVLPFIFERFRQADSTSTRKQKGLGLGLAIARHLVELHGGTIEAASAGEGKGATFTVSLPLILSEPAAVARAEERASPSATLEGITVLVVDDEEDAREAMTVLLGQAGARVFSVPSAAEALETMARTRPDVLLSDIAMPGEDGYALIRRVRSLPVEQGARTPAAALTAYATLEDRAKALRSGYDEHIPKPVDPARLVAAITLLVEAARRTRR
jgi:signal transduction histidine kinase/ActR/RegA family two-component response regulator